MTLTTTFTFRSNFAASISSLSCLWKGKTVSIKKITVCERIFIEGNDASNWSVFYLMSSSLKASSLSCSARSNDSQAYMWWKNNVKNQIKEALTRYIRVVTKISSCRVFVVCSRGSRKQSWSHKPIDFLTFSLPSPLLNLPTDISRTESFRACVLVPNLRQMSFPDIS